MFFMYNRSDKNIIDIQRQNQNESVMDIQHGSTMDIQHNSVESTKSTLGTSQTR